LNYLVLHIDNDFISGTVCVGNATSVPITQGNDNILWLFFFNNPHQDRVSFGRENRIHYNERKVNYYGSFTEKITDDTETFTIRGIKKPIIELLEYSDLIKLVQSSYERVTRESSESIPTLITFSLSISDLSKQTLVDYLSKKGFDIKSYTIPLSELTCYSLHSKKKFSIANGSSVLFLSATNATLHIMKMVFSENYFMIDGEIESFKGKGIDPRKRALVKFVVNELNKSTGALSSSDEIEDECVRKEQQADEWLKRLDAQSSNLPLSIIESLSIMQSTKLQVLVRKEHIDKDTGHYVNELADIFDFFKSKYFTGDVAGLFLLGDCFLSSLVNKKFKNYVSEDKLFVFGNKDIPEILASYPKIDFKRYIDQESRIKALAEAEELKQIEQRALEDRLRKEQEMLQNEEALEKQAELNKIEAQRKYERSLELELEGKLEDAKVYIEQALLLDKTSKQISLHQDNLLEKIKIRNEKNELYKSYLNKAEKYKGQNEFDKALEEYEAAKTVFDNAEIVKAIIEVKRIIKELEKRQEKIADILLHVNSLLSKNKFDEAESKLNKVLEVDSTNEAATKLLAEIPVLKSKHLKEVEKQQKMQQYEEYVKVAKSLFESSKYQEAKDKFQLAASIKNDIQVEEGVKACNTKLKEIEDSYSYLLRHATQFEDKGDLEQAIDCLNQALMLKGENEELSRKIKKLRFDSQFKTSSEPSKPKSTTSKEGLNTNGKDKVVVKKVEDDPFAFANKKDVVKKTTKFEAKKDDDFLNYESNSKAKKSDGDFDIPKNSNKKNGANINFDNKDDFLNTQKINKTDDDFLFAKKEKKTKPKNKSNNINNKNPEKQKGEFDW
jgi:tetratricopeptide (TPR) repeat protein